MKEPKIKRVTFTEEEQVRMDRLDRDSNYRVMVLKEIEKIHRRREEHLRRCIRIHINWPFRQIIYLWVWLGWEPPFVKQVTNTKLGEERYGVIIHGRTYWLDERIK